jgi:hypothetical protein
MTKPVSPGNLIFSLLISLSFSMCKGVEPDKYANFIDTTSLVYGPYQVVKLPVNKGVRVLNPIQISAGPKGHASSDNAELFRDSFRLLSEQTETTGSTHATKAP